jgi:hypothetical protein
MRKSMLMGALAACLIVPMGAYAQPAPPGAGSNAATMQAGSKNDPSFSFSPPQAVALGAGIVAGVIAGEALLSSDLGVLVGGVVGGYLANIWYTGARIDMHVIYPPTKL